MKSWMMLSTEVITSEFLVWQQSISLSIMYWPNSSFKRIECRPKAICSKHLRLEMVMTSWSGSVESVTEPKISWQKYYMTDSEYMLFCLRVPSFLSSS